MDLASVLEELVGFMDSSFLHFCHMMLKDYLSLNKALIDIHLSMPRTWANGMYIMLHGIMPNNTVLIQEADDNEPQLFLVQWSNLPANLSLLVRKSDLFFLFFFLREKGNQI